MKRPMNAISTSKEREPDAEEAGERRPPPCAAAFAANRQQRQQDERGARRDRLHQRGGQGEVADVEQPDSAPAAEGQNLGGVRPPEEAVEVGPVIGRGADVELVAAHERLALPAQQALRRLVEVRAIEHVEAVGLAGRHAGNVDQVECPPAGERAHRPDLRVGQRWPADRQGGGAPASDPRDVVAGWPDRLGLQRSEHRCEQAHAVARGKPGPDRERGDAVTGQPGEHRPYRLDRQQPLRFQRMQPGDAGPERDDLDEVVLVAGRLDERARIGDVDADIRTPVDLSREMPVAAADHVHDMRLQLHRIHRPGPGSERLQHRGAAPGAEHQHARFPRQPIGQRGREILEIRGRRRRRIVTHDRDRAIGVDEQGHLLRHGRPGHEAQARRAAKRHLPVLHRAHGAERAGTGLDELRAGDPERLGKRLEGRNPQLPGHPEARKREDDDAEQQQGPAARAAPTTPDGQRPATAPSPQTKSSARSGGTR